jgi:hypothetical protein
MKLAFEAHEAEIMAALQSPPILAEVTKILLESNNRAHDREIMVISAYSFFAAGK